MEIKDYIDHLRFGQFYVYVIDKNGKQLSKTKYNGETDIYFVSADYNVQL